MSLRPGKIIIVSVFQETIKLSGAITAIRGFWILSM